MWKRIGSHKKFQSWDQALSDSEWSLSDADCKAAKDFLKDAGDGSDLGVGFKKTDFS